MFVSFSCVPKNSFLELSQYIGRSLPILKGFFLKFSLSHEFEKNMNFFSYKISKFIIGTILISLAIFISSSASQ